MANHRPTGIALAQPLPAPAGQPGIIIGTLSTQDPDAGDFFAYSFFDGRFQVVDGNELALMPGMALTWGKATSLKLAVTVTDLGGLSLTRTLTLALEPNHAPTDLTLSPRPVATGQFGAHVGTLVGTDPDPASPLSYSTTDARFFVMGSELFLAGGVALDWNTAPSTTVKVKVTDPGGLSLTKTLTISVGGLDIDRIDTAVGTLGRATVSAVGVEYIPGGAARAEWAPGTLRGTGAAMDSVLLQEVAQGGNGGTGPAGPDGRVLAVGRVLDAAGGGTAGGRGTATFHDTALTMAGGSNVVALRAEATGGAGGMGGFGKATGPYSDGIGGHGGNAEAGIASINHLSLTASGSLDLRLLGHAHGGMGGAGGTGGTGGLLLPGSGQFTGAGGDGGTGGNGGAAIADASDNIFNAAAASSGVFLQVEVVAEGGTRGAGGQAGALDRTDSSMGVQQAVGGHAGRTGEAAAGITGNQVTTGGGNDQVQFSAAAQGYQAFEPLPDGVVGGGGGGGDIIIVPPPDGGVAPLAGLTGKSHIDFTGNSVALGAGSDTLQLKFSLIDATGGVTALQAGTFTFSGNSFNGGTGFNTLDLRGILGAGTKVDVAANLLSIADSPGNTLQNFQAFLGTSGNDSFVDGRRDQVYAGGDGADSFLFSRGHGKDVLVDFGPGDHVRLSGFGTALDSFSDLLARATEGAAFTAADGQTYTGVLVSTPDGGQLMLANALKINLVSADFLFA